MAMGDSQEQFVTDDNHAHRHVLALRVTRARSRHVRQLTATQYHRRTTTLRTQLRALWHHHTIAQQFWARRRPQDPKKLDAAGRRCSHGILVRPDIPKEHAL